MSIKSFIISRKKIPILLSVPGLVITILLIVIPLVYNIYLSFHERAVFGEGWTWVGLYNYEALFNDGEFFLSFKNGLIYAITSVFFQILLGLLFALYLNRKMRSKKLFLGTLIFPYLIPTALVVLLWKWILSTDGLINFILKDYSLIENEINFLSKDLALPTLIFISVWQFFPFVLIIILGALQSIDQNLYKSLKIDGGSSIDSFKHIIFPHIKNLLGIIILIRTLWMFTKFDTVYIFIGETSIYKYAENVPVYAYRQAFQSFQLGMGAALTTILLLFLLIVTLVFFRKFLFTTN